MSESHRDLKLHSLCEEAHLTSSRA